MATAIDVKSQAHAMIDRMDTTQVSSVVAIMATMLDPFSHALANTPVEDEAVARGWLRDVLARDGAPIPGWVRPLIAAFNEISSLPDDWDTYGAKAVKVERIEESFSVLRLVMQPNSPAPSVVPLSDGGVQFE